MHSMLVIAIGCHFVFLAMPDLHTGIPHQTSSFPAANRITQRIQRFPDSAAAIAMITEFRYISNHFKHFIMTLLLRIAGTANMIVVGTTAYTHELAHQANRVASAYEST